MVWFGFRLLAEADPSELTIAGVGGCLRIIPVPFFMI